MAQQLINDDGSNTQVICEALKDFGIPVGRALQMGRAFASSNDYLQDVKGFLDNYNRFTELQSAAESLDINLVENLAGDKLKELVDQLDNSWNWDYLSSVLPDGAATDGNGQCSTSKELAEKQHLEAQIKELNEFKETWHKVFNSPEAMQQKADELLQRNKWMKIIELAVVFKDVCLGINRAIKTSKKLQQHRQELIRINNEYVQPVITAFNKSGHVDNAKIETALMQLRYIKTNCAVEQKETAQSWFGHLANAVSMGFQAYASFTNASALADVASKAIVNQTYVIGAVQGGLSVGSMVLSGVEAYNYIQYQNIIDDVNAMIKRLEFYSNQVSKIK